MGESVMSFIRNAFAAVIAFLILGLLVVPASSAIQPAGLLVHSPLAKTIVRPNGSILAAGWTSPVYDQNAAPIPFVIKLGSDGGVESGFSDGGVLRLDDLPGEVPRDLLASPGGGFTLITNRSIVKINENGSLRKNFADDGVLRRMPAADTGGVSMTATGMDANGRIVVAGATYHEGIYAARYTAAGTLDTSFGSEGIVHIVAPHPGGLVNAFEVGFDALGRIVVAGEIDYAGGAMRLLENGQLDPSFGPGGNGFTGLFGDDETYGIFEGVYDLAVDPDGEIRVYGVYNPQLYDHRNAGYFFDDGGMPTGPPTSYGFGGSGVFAETPDGGMASTEAPFRGQSFGFSVLKSNADFTYRPSLSPGESNTKAIAYSPDDNALVAVGEASGRECTNTCSEKTYGVVAKIDADTGEPTPGFGTGGAMLIPANQCHYGKSDPYDHDVPTPWNRCRVKPPKFKAKISFTHPKSRKPGINGVVVLTGAPRSPGFLKRKLMVTLPGRLKLRSKNLRKRLVTKVTGAAPAFTDVSVKGRSLVIKYRPDFSGFDPYEELFSITLPPSNGRTRFQFRLRPGALKPIRKSVRRSRLNFRLYGTYAPSSTFSEAFDVSDYQGVTSIWSGPNSASMVSKARPVKRKSAVSD